MRQTRESAGSLATLLFVGAFAFAGAWQLGWWLAGSGADRASREPEVRSLGGQMQTLACALVLLPSCPPGVPIVAPPTEAHGRSYRELFASVPDLGAALEMVHWNQGDEAEAARLLSVIRALVLGRNRQADSSGRERLELLLGEIWQSHPELVTASACTYCGDMPRFARALLERHEPDPEWSRRLAAGHPTRLRLLGSEGHLEPLEIREAAVLHAELSHAGEPATARYVASVLIENQDFAPLLAWVTKGLGGGRALDDVGDLGALPPEIVRGAWEHGVSIGGHPTRLTDHLVGEGYRPALRWTIWVLDGSAPYIEAHRGKYRAILRRHVDFPAHRGTTLAEFYSAHWRAITWHPEARKWRLRG
ncbi:MAG: hypothetical protein QNK04_09695 [Myxococcota bacterium]|nr:hypothetical protein [Myxococcota bacterium]